MDLFQKILAWFILVVATVVFFVGATWLIWEDTGSWAQAIMFWVWVVAGLAGITAFCWAVAKVFG